MTERSRAEEDNQFNARSGLIHSELVLPWPLSTCMYVHYLIQPAYASIGHGPLQRQKWPDAYGVDCTSNPTRERGIILARFLQQSNEITCHRPHLWRELRCVWAEQTGIEQREYDGMPVRQTRKD